MILHQFVTRNRAEIVTRARLRIATRIAPIPTEAELEVGVDFFLDDLLAQLAPTATDAPEAGRPPMIRSGFTIAQVVYDFGDICQAITELVGERQETLDAREFRILNQCLDDAIARAVTEFARRRDVETGKAETERLQAFTDRLRAPLSTALLAFEMVQRGTVGTTGSTGALIAQSLCALRRVIEQTVALAKLESGSASRGPIELARLMEDIEVPAIIDARGHGVRFAGAMTDRDRFVLADRELLLMALTTLVDAAVLGSARGGLVSLSIHPRDPLTWIDVVAGGTAPGDASEDGRLLLSRRALAACGASLEIEPVAEGRRYRVILQGAPGPT